MKYYKCTHCRGTLPNSHGGCTAAYPDDFSPPRSCTFSGKSAWKECEAPDPTIAEACDAMRKARRVSGVRISPNGSGQVVGCVGSRVTIDDFDDTAGMMEALASLAYKPQEQQDKELIESLRLIEPFPGSLMEACHRAADRLEQLTKDRS